MKYLLDTNIFIYIIKKNPQSVFNRLLEIPPDQLSVSAISVAELEYGVRKSSQPEKNQLALKNFLKPLSVLSFDFNATIEYGMIRSNLEKKGIPIGPLDLLIAAHAKSLNYTLVTNNEKEFSRIEGLKIENWV